MAKKPRPKNLTTPRRAGTAGILGAALFATTLVLLTAIQYEFMLSIGWEPLSDPGGAWPSGLALGPYGWAMNANFMVSGVSLVFFSIGLRRGVAGAGIGAVLLAVSGLAMAFMAFETDPILRDGPRSFHGWAHDISFVVFALSLLASMFFLWREFRSIPDWRSHARRTLAAGMIAVVCLILAGVAYYLFVGVLLVWIVATSLKLRA